MYKISWTCLITAVEATEAEEVGVGVGTEAEVGTGVGMVTGAEAEEEEEDSRIWTRKTENSVKLDIDCKYLGTAFHI